MEQEGLGGEDEIYGEPNERETEPLLALPPEPPAAYEKFRVGRQRQQRKRWIIPAQFALKLSFWSLGMWGHRAWKYISQTFLVIAFVCIEFPIVYAAYNSQSEICSVCSTSYNYSIGTEKWRTCCYKWKYNLVANGTFFTASLLSYLVFVACYVVGKRTTSALVCPPRFLIKETDKPVIFVLFLAFLVMNVFSTITTVINICATSKFETISLKYAFSAVLFFLLPAWVSLNVCHTFASICIVLGTFAEDTLRLIRDPQNRTLDDVIRVHEDLITVVSSTVSAYSVWFLTHVFLHGVENILFMIFIIIIAARRFERSELAPEDAIYLVLLLLYFFYFFISPIVFAARISSRCAEIYEKINCSCTDDWNEGHPFKDRNNISLFVSYAKNRPCGFKAGRITFVDSLTWVSFLFTVVALLFPIVQHGLLPN